MAEILECGTHRLDAAPLIEWLEYTEQIGRIDRGTLQHWRANGLSVWNADKWAIRYGIHPVRLWGFDFYDGVTL